MTYDFAGSWSKITDHHTPLYSTGQSAECTVRAVEAYIKNGCPPAKLNIGAAMYGRAFAGVQNVNDGLWQPFASIPSGNWEAGVFDYKAIMLMILAEHYDDQAKASWCFNKDK